MAVQLMATRPGRASASNALKQRERRRQPAGLSEADGSRIRAIVPAGSMASQRTRLGGHNPHPRADQDEVLKRERRTVRRQGFACLGPPEYETSSSVWEEKERDKGMRREFGCVSLLESEYCDRQQIVRVVAVP